MPQYAFSLNGENWSGAFDTRVSALKAAIQKCSGAADPPGTVYVAEIAAGEAFADRLGAVVIKEMRSRARSRGVEGSARWLRDLSATQLAELDGQVEHTIVAWLAKSQLMPQSFKVGAISEHAIPLPHRGLARASSNNGNGNGREVQDLGVGEFPG
jgi:hypothetical protein